jgi:hypothetical protein
VFVACRQILLLLSCIDAEDPFGFEGPEIYKCKGCTIHWKQGKNVTVKTVKKKQVTLFLFSTLQTLSTSVNVAIPFEQFLAKN